MNDGTGLKKSLLKITGYNELYSIDGIGDAELLNWISTPNKRMSAEKELKVLKYIKNHDEEIYSPENNLPCDRFVEIESFLLEKNINIRNEQGELRPFGKVYHEILLLWDTFTDDEKNMIEFQCKKKNVKSKTT